MIRAVLLAVGLTTFSAAAIAQTTSSPQTGGNAQTDSQNTLAQLLTQGGDDSSMDRDRGSFGRGGRRGDRSYYYGRGGDSRDSDRDDDTWQRGGRRFGGTGSEMAEHAWRMMGAGAVRFRIRRGENAADIRCPGGTELKACVDAAGQLLDKLGGGSGAASSSPPSPSQVSPPANR